MSKGREIDGSTGVSEFYGKELRYKREAAGLTLEQVVEGSFYGISYLSEIERGKRRMPEDLARHVDRLMETDGLFERRCDDVRRARTRGHAKFFERALEAERRAETIEEWCPTVFPGLLQTEPYIRALFRAERPLEPREKTDVKVNARLARATLLEDDHAKPEYWLILHESLLRTPVLPPRQLAEQLDRVASLGRRQRIFPQVVPWNAGAHPFVTGGSAKIMTFADEPPLVYTESLHTGCTIDDPGLVKQYRRSYDLLRAAALPPEASLAMIEAAAEDCRNGEQPDGLERRYLA
ncbi:helix-turn-helix transcriptional regulator [Streptomyces subrutilus]|uniref:helix-turn-helix domain-containing protein n=1 Tax=Streptomyces subrutilus TaxID=36818 RepID=UPI0034200D64